MTTVFVGGFEDSHTTHSAFPSPMNDLDEAEDVRRMIACEFHLGVDEIEIALANPSLQLPSPESKRVVADIGKAIQRL